MRAAPTGKILISSSRFDYHGGGRCITGISPGCGSRG